LITEIKILRGELPCDSSMLKFLFAESLLITMESSRISVFFAVAGEAFAEENIIAVSNAAIMTEDNRLSIFFAGTVFFIEKI
jgi:hypothetical protein